MKYLLVDCSYFDFEKTVFLVDENAKIIEEVGQVSSAQDLIKICSEQGVKTLKIKQGQHLTEEVNKLSITNYDHGVKAEDI